MAWEYSEKTKQLFIDAVQGKAGTHLGEINPADGFGEHGSIACGDAMRFTFRTERHPSDPTQDKIVEAKYQTFGCTSAIAASEALCSIIEAGEYTPIQALEISNDDIVRFLGGGLLEKAQCPLMITHSKHQPPEFMRYGWILRGKLPGQPCHFQGIRGHPRSMGVSAGQTQEDGDGSRYQPEDYPCSWGFDLG